MQLNLLGLKDDLGGNWWHHVSASNFGFLEKIPDLKSHSVEPGDFLIHKEKKEGDRFPTIRYHLVLKKGTKTIENIEAKEYLAENLVGFVKHEGRFPFACTLAKIFKNGSAQVNYKPTGFDNFALKISPKTHGIDDVESFFSELETVKENPSQAGQVEVEVGSENKWEVPSSSNPSKTYTVERKANGTWSCTCPQYLYRKQECKHIKKYK